MKTRARDIPRHYRDAPWLRWSRGRSPEEYLVHGVDPRRRLTLGPRRPTRRLALDGGLRHVD